MSTTITTPTPVLMGGTNGSFFWKLQSSLFSLCQGVVEAKSGGASADVGELSVEGDMRRVPGSYSPPVGSSQPQTRPITDPLATPTATLDKDCAPATPISCAFALSTQTPPVLYLRHLSPHAYPHVPHNRLLFDRLFFTPSPLTPISAHSSDFIPPLRPFLNETACSQR